jgi:hypothetical protein
MLVWQSVMDDASKLAAVIFEYKLAPRQKKKSTHFFVHFNVSQVGFIFLATYIPFGLYGKFYAKITSYG